MTERPYVKAVPAHIPITEEIIERVERMHGIKLQGKVLYNWKEGIVIKVEGNSPLTEKMSWERAVNEAERINRTKQYLRIQL